MIDGVVIQNVLVPKASCTVLGIINQIWSLGRFPLVTHLLIVVMSRGTLVQNVQPSRFDQYRVHSEDSNLSFYLLDVTSAISKAVGRLYDDYGNCKTQTVPKITHEIHPPSLYGCPQ